MINLTTLDEVKCMLETIDTKYDEDITNRIEDVSERIQSFLDRNLEQQTYIEVKNGGCKTIYPYNPPIASITGIISSVVFDFSQGTTIPTTDYLVVNQDWDVDHLFLWPGGRNQIQITYIGGYLDADNVASTLPKDLRGAATKQVAFEFTNRKFIGQTTIDVADGQINIPEKAFLDSVTAVLKRYRITKLG